MRRRHSKEYKYSLGENQWNMWGMSKSTLLQFSHFSEDEVTSQRIKLQNIYE